MPEVAAPVAQGRYLLTEKLGAGGMAVVYRAWDARLKVWRAVKVLAPAAAARSDLRARFEIEAQTMARLRHANVLAVHDVGHDDEHGPYLVMDIVPGGSLNDLVRRTGPLGPRLAATTVADVLAGLAAAHAAGVVHRDVKPHNVLLDAEGKPLVSDFGIARILEEDTGATRTGMALGTQAYMAPEQRSSARTVDARADVFAAGATLLALVTGRDPYDLAVDEALTEQLANVPPAIAAIIRRATRWDPEQRWPSAEAMRAALREAADALPTEAELRDRLPIIPPPGAPPTEDKRTISDWSGADEPGATTPPPGTTAPGEAVVLTAGGTAVAGPVDDDLPHEATDDDLAHDFYDAHHAPTTLPRWAWAAGAIGMLGIGGIAAFGIATLWRPAEPATPPLPAVVTWSEHAITALPPAVRVYGADLSPDGARVVWSASDGVWTAATDAGVPDLVALPAAWTAGPVGFAGSDGLLVVRRADREVGRSDLSGNVTDLAFQTAGPIAASPDGTAIAWQATDGVHVRDGVGDRLLRPLPATAPIVDLAWSATGDRLAIASIDVPGKMVVDVIGAHGDAIASVDVLGAWPGEDGVAWNTDGRLLVSHRIATGVALDAIDAKTHAAETLTTAGERGLRPLRRVGDRILAWRGSFPSDVWAGTFDVDGPHLSQVTVDEREDAPDAITDAGDVYYTTWQDGNADAWVQTIGNLVAKRLAGGDGYQGSPVPIEGGGLFFDASTGTCVITRVHDGLIEPLLRTGPRDDCGALRCDSKGRTCAFVADDTNDVQVADLGLRTAKSSGAHSSAYAIAPDGSGLAVSTGTAIRFIPLVGPGEAQEVPVGATIDGLDWSGADVWVLAHAGDDSAIWRVTADGATRVAALDVADRQANLVVSPSGTELAVSAITDDDDLWLIQRTETPATP